MFPFVNQEKFQAALSYVMSEYYSKPYEITPMVDRWFNQLALVQLSNGQIVSLTAQ